MLYKNKKKQKHGLANHQAKIYNTLKELIYCKLTFLSWLVASFLKNKTFK